MRKFSIQEIHRKGAIKEERANAEETRALAKLLAEENRIMMINQAKMDEVTLEWHTVLRQQILLRRKQATIDAGSDAAAVDGGGGGVNDGAVVDVGGGAGRGMA